jgi:death on curing protein
VHRLALEDLPVIAEPGLGLPQGTLLKIINKPLAESALAAPFVTFGDHVFYPDLPTRAAILASRLIRNHPLPDGNKRLALIAMIEFLRRNDEPWPSTIAPDEIVDTFVRVASRELSEVDFIAWVKGKVAR